MLMGMLVEVDGFKILCLFRYGVSSILEQRPKEEKTWKRGSVVYNGRCLRRVGPLDRRSGHTGKEASCNADFFR